MHDWLSRLAESQSQTPETFRAHTDKPGDSPEIITVTYQRIWFDYDLRDGIYTPAELQVAKRLVKPGAVLRYRLRWPGGTPRPIDGGYTSITPQESTRCPCGIRYGIQ